MSTSELLQQVQAAISALITGGAQSYSIGARTVTRLNLGELMEWEQRLLERLNKETGSGAFTLGKISRYRR